MKMGSKATFWLVGSVIVIMSLLVVGLRTFADFKSAQDYAVIGVLEAGPSIRADVDRFLNAGFEVQVVMTARTSSAVKDVVLQRRWVKAALPLQFGLGKDRGTHLAKTIDGLHLTALVEIIRPRDRNVVATYVGWTPGAVPIGSESATVQLIGHLDDPSLTKTPGFPGAFESFTIAEEALPPGLLRRNSGAFVFGGEIDVVPESARLRLRAFDLTLIARERVDRGFPELILKYAAPVYPLQFALHQGDKQIDNENLVEAGKFVVARIDLDGNVETREDAWTAATTEKVAPGTKDIRLVLDVSELMTKLDASAKAPQIGGAGNVNPRPSAERGKLLVAGRLELPANAIVPPGARLFLSIWDSSNQMVLAVNPQTDVDFPHEFSVHAGDSALPGPPPKVEGLFTVKATLTAGDPSDPQADGFSIRSEPLDGVVSGVVLQLKAQ